MAANQQVLLGYGGSAFDSDAQAFFTAAGITDATQKSAVNQLVLDLKAASLWTKFYAIYPYVGGDATKHSYNLKNPITYQITWGGSVTHNSNGFTGDSTTGWGNTNLNQNSVISANNEHISLYSRTDSAISTDVDMGILDSVFTKGTSLQLRNSSGNWNVYSQGSVTGTTLITPSSLGFFSVNRTDSAGFRFRQSALNIDAGMTQDTRANGNFAVGGQNTTGAGIAAPSGRNYCWNAIGQGLTQAEDFTLYGIVQVFQTTLGRQFLDYDLQLFLTATGITDATQKSALTTLVNDLKNYGLWTKMKAIYPFVGGTATTHKYNLKNAQDTDGAFRIVWNGTVTHDSNGITPNGTTGYGDTKLNGSTQSLNNDSHLSVYVRTNSAAADKTEISAYNGANAYWSIKVRDTGNVTFNGIYRFVTDGFISVAGNTNSSGFYVLTRRSASDAESYKNGSSTGTTTTTSQSIPSATVKIGVRGDAVASFSDRNIAFASIGNGLTDTEAANFHTAVEAFQDALSRGIV